LKKNLEINEVFNPTLVNSDNRKFNELEILFMQHLSRHSGDCPFAWHPDYCGEFSPKLHLMVCGGLDYNPNEPVPAEMPPFWRSKYEAAKRLREKEKNRGDLLEERNMRDNVRAMCDERILKYRTEISGGATESILARLDAYIVGFQGAKGSVFENHLHCVARRNQIVEVDGEGLLLPERIAENFAEAVRQRFPKATVKLGRYLTFG